jgi:tripartite-type tricarboxylate transporter receptor subunit TctC
MNNTTRRLTAALAAVAVCGLAFGHTPQAAAQVAQGWPNKPIRLVVPLAAGGGTDLAARVVAQALGDALGQQVVVDNKPGAGGVIGIAEAAKAAPDGHTFVIGSTTTMAANMFLYRNVSFDPLKDFVPLAMLGTIEFAFVVPATSKVTNLRELIGAAKAQPGRLSYGFGSSAALICGELFNTAAGTDIVKVPYRGTPQSLTDLVADRIQLLCEPLGTSLPFIRDGKLRALAVTGSARDSKAPEVPTMAEAGLKFEYHTWAGFFAPAGTPPAIVQRLAAELVKVQNQPAVAERVRATGFIPKVLGPQEFGALHRADYVRIEKIIKDAGIKPE